MSSFYLVTFATHSERYYPLLQQRGLVTNIGWNKPWRGWYDRAQNIIRFCETLDENAIVCFIDGFDSVILSDEPHTEIPNKFKTHFSKYYDLVFSVELPHGMLSDYVRNKLFQKCDNSHLNAGCYIGYAWAIKRFWKNIQPGDDDQQYGSDQCRVLVSKQIENFEDKNDNENDNDNVNEETPSIRFGLDNDCLFFFNYFKSIPFTIEDNRIVLFEKHKPAILSGPAFQNLNPILEQLGYSRESLPQSSFKVTQKYYIGRTKEFAQYFLFEFFVLLTLFFTIILIIGTFIYTLLQQCGF